jgi:hypothetical protein
MKYRRSTKIKQQHSIIEGVLEILLDVSELDAVKSIVPGRIKKAKAYSPPILTVSTETDTGLKFIAKSGRSVQEIFTVCADKAFVTEFVEQMHSSAD